MGSIKGGYLGRDDFCHDQCPRLGVLLINLGTPKAASPRALRRYLAEFLNDPRVIEMRPLWRRALVHGVVLRVRPRRSARAYRAVWTPAGSPLLVHSRALEQGLRKALTVRLEGPVSVALGMCYGEPRIDTALRLLSDAGAERIVALPLYPQYSGSSTGAAFDAVAGAIGKMRRVPGLRFVDHYHDHPRYIAALAQSVRHHWDKHGTTERLLFSFHGTPRASLLAGDPYYCQCQATARLVAESLVLPRAAWAIAFQSRFGRTRWLEPATDTTLVAWGNSGVKSVSTICPGFAVDCLETLEEVAIRYREVFLRAGGVRFDYIPALNSHASHVGLLAELVAREACGWPEALASYSAAAVNRAVRERVRRAKRQGAEQ